MQKLMKAMHKNEKGFTLVELMVVVVIIGVLVAIAVPIYNTITRGAETSAIEANIRTLNGSISMMITSDDAPTGGWTTTNVAVGLISYVEGWTNSPENAVVMGPGTTSYAVSGTSPNFTTHATVPAGVGPNITAAAVTYRLVAGELVAVQ